MVGACSTYGGVERRIQGLVVTGEGKGPLVRSRHRWEDNIKMDLQKAEMGGLDCIDVAHDKNRRLTIVNAVMNSGFHKIS